MGEREEGRDRRKALEEARMVEKEIPEMPSSTTSVSGFLFIRQLLNLFQTREPLISGFT